MSGSKFGIYSHYEPSARERANYTYMRESDIKERSSKQPSSKASSRALQHHIQAEKLNTWLRNEAETRRIELDIIIKAQKERLDAIPHMPHDQFLAIRRANLLKRGITEDPEGGAFSQKPVTPGEVKQARINAIEERERVAAKISAIEARTNARIAAEEQRQATINANKIALGIKNSLNKISKTSKTSKK